MDTRYVGTVARGIAAPVPKAGEDLAALITETVLNAASQEGVILHKSDVLGVDGSMLARAQGNLLSVQQLSEEIKTKFEEAACIGLLWPGYSTSRMAAMLRALARSCDKLVMQFGYPLDETGRRLMDLENLYDTGIDPNEDTLSEEAYRALFADCDEENVGEELMDFCRAIAEQEGCEIVFVFSNHPDEILKYTRNVLYGRIHRSRRLDEKLIRRGARILYGLRDLCREESSEHGYNKELGILGAECDGAEAILLAPRDVEAARELVAARIEKETGVKLNVSFFSPYEGEEADSGELMGSLCREMSHTLFSHESIVLLQGMHK